jgi:chemotaxis protein CheX
MQTGDQSCLPGGPVTVTASPSAVVALGAEDLKSLLREAWETVLESPLWAPEDAEPGLFDVSASISITGDVNLTVTLEATDQVVETCAVTMLGLEPDELSPEDVLDAFGEMANIVGGGVKSRVADAARLGLPTVVRGAGLRTTIPGAEPAGSVLLVGAAGPVRASIWRQR